MGERRDRGRRRLLPAPGQALPFRPDLDLAALSGRLAEDPRTGTFLRGLTIGALVGAAIAGSTIWGRLRRRGG